MTSMRALCGVELDAVSFVDIAPATTSTPASSSGWVLHGLMSNLRYATRSEVSMLRARQEPLGRSHAMVSSPHHSATNSAIATVMRLSDAMSTASSNA